MSDQGPGRRQQRRRAAFWLFATTFAVYLLTAKGFIDSVDGEAMFQVAQSLVERGAFDVLPEATEKVTAVEGRDGRLYGVQGPGMSLVSVPLYVIGRVAARYVHLVEPPWVKRAVVSLLCQVLTALTCVVIMLWLWDLGYKPALGVTAGLAYGFGTMAWPYSKDFFAEVLAALCLVACGHGVWLFAHRGGPGAAVYAGLGAAGTLLARPELLPALAVVGGYAILRVRRGSRSGERRGRNVWWGAAGLGIVALALAFLGWYNVVRFGAWYSFGQESFRAARSPWLRGVYGFLLSPGRGLLWYSPVLALGLLGWRSASRDVRDITWVGVIILALLVAFYAQWRDWHGDWCWGPRRLLPALPLAALLLAPAAERIPKGNRRLKLACGMVLGLSLAIQLAGVSVSYKTYLMGQARQPVRFDDTVYRLGAAPWWRHWAELPRLSLSRLDRRLSSGSRAERRLFVRQLRLTPDYWFCYLIRLGVPWPLSVAGALGVAGAAVGCSLALAGAVGGEGCGGQDTEAMTDAKVSEIGGSKEG